MSALQGRHMRARKAAHDELARPEGTVNSAIYMGIYTATRVRITEEAIEAFDNDRNGSEAPGNIEAGLRGALTALGFAVIESWEP